MFTISGSKIENGDGLVNAKYIQKINYPDNKVLTQTSLARQSAK